MRRAEQLRVLQSLPGLEGAVVLRYGSIHRNTYVDAPTVLGERLELRGTEQVLLAGQMTGVEGYVESTASGLLAGLFLAAELESGGRGEPLPLPPETTALGGLHRHLRRHPGKFEPSNVTFAMIPPVEVRAKKRVRRDLAVERALGDIDRWLQDIREMAGRPEGAVPSTP